jgi:hypothetical protein
MSERNDLQLHGGTGPEDRPQAASSVVSMSIETGGCGEACNPIISKRSEFAVCTLGGFSVVADLAVRPDWRGRGMISYGRCLTFFVEICEDLWVPGLAGSPCRRDAPQLGARPGAPGRAHTCTFGGDC